MAKFFLNGKWKKRTVTALSLALSLTLATGIFTACGGTGDSDEDDDDDAAVAETDTQLLKNGNFEFFTESTKELDERRALIYSPTSWSITSGSPTSDTASGIIGAGKTEWDFLTASKFSLLKFDLNADDSENKTQEKANEAVAYAVENWDKASAYDRLEFLSKYDAYFTDYKISTLNSESEAGKLFAEYKYTVDFEDVEKLRSELGDDSGALKTHDTDGEDEENHVLMIHNSRDSDGVLGTGQYYTSSTTITLEEGTAAELSVWVKTSNLTHYYSSNAVEVTSTAGAYIGVTHTVGGTTLDQMQIKNINTRLVEENNGWQQYSIYIRANTFASSTFKIVLGLGMGDTSNRYEQVNGYALFDDLTCKIIDNAEYEEKAGASGVTSCDLNSLKDDKIFDATKLSGTVYALDLHAEFTSLTLNDAVVSEPKLTSQYSGSKLYESLIPDNRTSGSGVPENQQSVVGLYSYNALKGINNDYLEPILENDFQAGLFPFTDSNSLDKQNVIMLLSTKDGAAYTATVTSDTFKLEPHQYMLVSFFVKTSQIRSGKTGATAILVDDKENEFTISAFDSTTVSTVDIDKDKTDIYNGWVQCFFFVSNTTEEAHDFSLKLCYGPTAVAGSSESDYGDGYAAFAKFETMMLTPTQYGYASTGTYAQKVSLTGKVSSAAKFDDAAATSDIETELAKPVNFYGVQSGSINLVKGGVDNPTTAALNGAGLWTGLLNSEYADAYENGDEAWNDKLKEIANGNDLWSAVFGDASVNGMAATQPLVIMNTSDKELPAYGYFAKTATISAATYQKISLRVKLSVNAKAYIYLIDTSDIKAGFDNTLSPVIPPVTYWYDDEGNICAGDPSEKETEVAYYLDENNGLYTKAGETNGIYYANLANYETDGDGNLVTTTGTVAYYFNDGKYYTDYDKTTNVFSGEVLPVPAEGDIVRYAAPTAEEMKNYASCIVVEGTSANAGQWIDVSFYVHTGSAEKSYRLELWAGARDDYSKTVDDGNITVTPGTGKGIPAGGYVFFDNYSAATTNDYDTTIAEYIAATKELLNSGKALSDPEYLGEDDNLPAGSALYYTFSFYDSPDFLRYDVSKDDLDEYGDPLGNPYGSYKQSAYSEQLVWFAYNNFADTDAGFPVMAQFLDYSAYDVNVPQDDVGNTPPAETPSEDPSSTNILLVLSSALLAFALLFAIGAILFKRLRKKFKKNGTTKPAKQQKPKLRVVKSESETVEEPDSETETVEDENGPYSE